MATTVNLPRDALLPQPPGGTAPGAALAVAVHLGLLWALTAAVDWRSRPPEAAAVAELWAAVPRQAAPMPAPAPAPAPEPSPAPVPPPPPPAPAPAPTPAPKPAPAPPPPPPAPAPAPTPRADIALEAEKRRQAEREAAAQRRAEAERKAQAEREAQAQKQALQRQAEAEKAEKAEKAKREQAAADERKRQDAAKAAEAERVQKQARAAEEARLAQQREENLRRMMNQAGAAASSAPSTGNAATSAAPSANYSARLVALIRSNIVFTGAVNALATAEVEVRAGPSGTILSRRLVKSSGQPDWDEAVLRAVDRTATLPRDTDGRVPPVLIVTFRPRE